MEQKWGGIGSASPCRSLWVEAKEVFFSRNMRQTKLKRKLRECTQILEPIECIAHKKKISRVLLLHKYVIPDKFLGCCTLHHGKNSLEKFIFTVKELKIKDIFTDNTSIWVAHVIIMLYHITMCSINFLFNLSSELLYLDTLRLHLNMSSYHNVFLCLFHVHQNFTQATNKK